MIPREVVRRTLEFDSPPRVPRQTWLLPWAEIHHPEAARDILARYPDDMVSAPDLYRRPLPTEGDRYGVGRFKDDWGCVCEGIQAGVIGEVKEPILTDWSLAADLRLPIERLDVDRDAVNAFCRDTDRFVIAGTFPRPFERLQFLRGSETLYLDLLERPAALDDLLARMHAFHLDELTAWAETEVDALMLMDDWGAQNAMLVDPTLWREMFRPLYAEYVALAHAHGKPMLLHSDGHITDIIPDLVDMGLDGLNAQVFCMDIEELGARFGGRLTFWGEMDRQRLLPEATTDEIVAAAARLEDAFWRDGGFIAQCEFGPGARPENIVAYFDYWAG